MLRKAMIVPALGLVCLLVLVGCFFQETRTCNQGCSSPVQAAAKLASGRIDSLNPDDIQVLVDLAIQAGAPLSALTDEQAAELVAFLAQEGITTVAQLQAKIEALAQDPNAIEIRRVLETLGGR